MGECICGQGQDDGFGRIIEFHALDCPASPVYEAYLEWLDSGEVVQDRQLHIPPSSTMEQEQ